VVSVSHLRCFLLDLDGLNHKFTIGGDKYIMVALLGKIKGESGDRVHLQPCEHVTSSKIDVWASLMRLIKFKRTQGFEDHQQSWIQLVVSSHIEL
jgi:hypothetical protein